MRFSIECEGEVQRGDIVVEEILYEVEPFIFECDAHTVRQSLGDDYICRYVRYGYGHLYLLFVGLVECCKEPEGGADAEEEQENQELLVQ